MGISVFLFTALYFLSDVVEGVQLAAAAIGDVAFAGMGLALMQARAMPGRAAARPATSQ